MAIIPQDEALANLPVAELKRPLSAFLAPVLARLPEQRHRDAGRLAVQGLLAAQSPILTEMARSRKGRKAETTWPVARRPVRCLWNPRFTQRHLLKGR